MNSRKIEEEKFHNTLRDGAFGQRWSPELERVIGNNPMWANMKYYSIERKSRNIVLSWYGLYCAGKKVLDYCCGNGDDSFMIINSGAEEVVGIDISKNSIDNCRARCEKEGYLKTASFHIMDAENLECKDDYFDVITEYGALHHLDLEKAYSELARVLKPEGKCICTETLGHNPLIRYYRKITPDLRTKWEVEHILCREDIELAKKYFGEVKIMGFFHLFTLCAVPFRNSKAFNFILNIAEAVDSVLLRFPWLKWQAWQVVFELSKPKKSASEKS